MQNINNIPTNNELCVVKLIPHSDTECVASVIFNGAIRVVDYAVTIDHPAHIVMEEEHIDGLPFHIQHAKQVGDGGLVPFVQQLRQKLPNCMLIEQEHFDHMVAEQKAAMENKVQ